MLSEVERVAKFESLPIGKCHVMEGFSCFILFGDRLLIQETWESNYETLSFDLKIKLTLLSWLLTNVTCRIYISISNLIKENYEYFYLRSIVLYPDVHTWSWENCLNLGNRIITKCVISALFTISLPWCSPLRAKVARPHVENSLYFDLSFWSENKSCWLPWLQRPSGPPFTASESFLNFLLVALGGNITP